MLISEPNFSAFVRTMASVLEDIERRQAENAARARAVQPAVVPTVSNPTDVQEAARLAGEEQEERESHAGSFRVEEEGSEKRRVCSRDQDFRRQLQPA